MSLDPSNRKECVHCLVGYVLLVDVCDKRGSTDLLPLGQAELALMNLFANGATGDFRSVWTIEGADVARDEGRNHQPNDPT